MLIYAVPCSFEYLFCPFYITNTMDKLRQFGIDGPPVLRQALRKEVGDVLEKKVKGNRYLWVVTLYPSNKEYSRGHYTQLCIYTIHVLYISYLFTDVVVFQDSTEIHQLVGYRMWIFGTAPGQLQLFLAYASRFLS